MKERPRRERPPPQVPNLPPPVDAFTGRLAACLEHWPKVLEARTDLAPVADTFAEFLDETRRKAGELVEATAAHLQRAVDAFVGPDRRAYVAHVAAARWPLALEGCDLVHLYSVCGWPPGDFGPHEWPPEAAPADVARWLAEGPGAELVAAAGVDLVEAWRGEQIVTFSGLALALPVQEPNVSFFATDGPPLAYRIGMLATLYLADRQGRALQERPVTRVPTGKGARDVVRAVGRRQLREVKEIGEILLFDGDGHQIKLPLRNDGGAAAIVQLVAKTRGAVGVRNWLALLGLLSAKGGATGSVQWTLEEHLKALGISERHQRMPKVRELHRDIVVGLTKLWIAKFDERGREVWKHPLFLIAGERGARLDKFGNVVDLDGLILQINEYVYAPVRNPVTKELDNRQWPTPAALAQLDHDPNHDGPAILLGTEILFMLKPAFEAGRNAHSFARRLMEYAGIPVVGEPETDEQGRPKANAGLTYHKALARLEETLETLRRIEVIGAWHWKDGRATLDGVIYLEPSHLSAVHKVGLLPMEAPPPRTDPQTGADLVGWRKGKGLSQADAAARLGVSVRTLKGAEAKRARPLGPALRKAFQQGRGT